MPTDQQNFNASKEAIKDPNLLLVEFWEEFSSTVHRAVRNNEDIIYDGETYAKASMNMTLPNAGEQQQALAMTFSNVDRVLGRAGINASARIQCRMMQVDGTDFTGSNPRTYNTLMWDTGNLLVLAKVDAGVLTVTGDLVAKLDLLTPYPFIKTSAAFFPGVYLTP